MVKKYPKAFSLKWNSDDYPVDELQILYSYYVNALKKAGIAVEYLVQEFDSKDRLHLHGLVRVPFGFRYEDKPFDGMSPKFKELKDEQGWLNYCRGNKGKDKPHNVLWPGNVPFVTGHYQDFTPSRTTRESREVVLNIITKYYAKQCTKALENIGV